MHIEVFKDLRRILPNVEGDIAEIGVFRGHNFVHLAQAAAEFGRVAHGFDSFVGMDDPSGHDGLEYPKGKFDVGGLDAAWNGMRVFMPEEHAALTEGFVPECLHRSVGLRFAFVYIDLDHYKPTVEAIKWAVPRLNMGGILAFDDWFHDRTNILAGKAIKEWLYRNEIDPLFCGYEGRDLWMVKDREWSC